jgi:hypothetical protein
MKASLSLPAHAYEPHQNTIFSTSGASNACLWTRVVVSTSPLSMKLTTQSYVYPSNVNCSIMLIAPTSGTVRVTFTAFATESCTIPFTVCDGVSLFNGGSTSGTKLLDDYDGPGMPSTLTYVPLA